MAKIKPKKERAEKYEPKVSFNGTFEDMVNISLTGAVAKKAEKKTTKSTE